jgi:hypothetical protein
MRSGGDFEGIVTRFEPVSGQGTAVIVGHATDFVLIEASELRGCASVAPHEGEGPLLKPKRNRNLLANSNGLFDF